MTVGRDIGGVLPALAKRELCGSGLGVEGHFPEMRLPVVKGGVDDRAPVAAEGADIHRLVVCEGTRVTSIERQHPEVGGKVPPKDGEDVGERVENSMSRAVAAGVQKELRGRKADELVLLAIRLAEREPVAARTASVTPVGDEQPSCSTVVRPVRGSLGH